MTVPKITYKQVNSKSYKYPDPIFRTNQTEKLVKLVKYYTQTGKRVVSNSTILSYRLSFSGACSGTFPDEMFASALHKTCRLLKN